MTAACAKLDHTVYAIKLRCAEGLRAASTRKTPSAAKMVKNIGAVVPPVGRSARREFTSAKILAPAVPRPNTTRTTCSARSRLDVTAIEASPRSVELLRRAYDGMTSYRFFQRSAPQHVILSGARGTRA